jgi:L-iditol 2-dehydrogenase
MLALRVAVYHNNRDVRLQDVPIPSIRPDEVLVKVLASGICGSDVLEWYRTKKAPLVLGHEISGQIVRVGENVKRFNVGDRVFVSHHVPCNKCRYCLDGHHTACETLHTTNFDPGGFSEYIRVPQLNVELGTYRLPDSLSYEDATFIEPLGCVIRGQRLAHIESDDAVLILGVGVAGLLHLQLAKSRNIRCIIASSRSSDVSEYRLKAARRFGADLAVSSGELTPGFVRDFNEGRLVDKIVVCTGALSAVSQAFQTIERGGTILFFAVPPPGTNVTVPMADFWRNEISLVTSYGASPGDLEESLNLLGSGKVNPHEMITHRLGLSEISRGFELVASAGESLKVVIEPQR